MKVFFSEAPLFLATRRGLQNLSSPTRNPTEAPGSESVES